MQYWIHAVQPKVEISSKSVVGEDTNHGGCGSVKDDDYICHGNKQKVIMNFENQLTDIECQYWFKKLFCDIWNEKSLTEILFLDKTDKELFFKKKKDGENKSAIRESDTSILAGFFGDSLWDVFSNNHTVFKANDLSAFEIGSWRGSGSFIAEFIEKENQELSFDYMDFYMGHFHHSDYIQKSYEFIFSQLKMAGFDWCYAYPEMGLVDFSKNKPDNMEAYNPNKSLETELETNKFLDWINNVNKERKESIQNSPLPPIIMAYGKIFNKFPEGWEET